MLTVKLGYVSYFFISIAFFVSSVCGRFRPKMMMVLMVCVWCLLWLFLVSSFSLFSLFLILFSYTIWSSVLFNSVQFILIAVIAVFVRSLANDDDIAMAIAFDYTVGPIA